jgi:hypothetical protein
MWNMLMPTPAFVRKPLSIGQSRLLARKHEFYGRLTRYPSILFNPPHQFGNASEIVPRKGGRFLSESYDLNLYR